MASQVSTDVLKSKHHFEILDGLRGVAAISVVVFHFMEFAVPDYEQSFIAHSYLAVDFFFCLSGFVIAYAYDTRLKQMGLANFFKLRLIRLHPLVIIGSIIGLLTFIFDPWSMLYSKYGAGQAAIMFFTSCFMIPYGIVPEHSFNLFNLNPPSWSLFWEYIANIIYAFVLVKISNKFLWVLVIIAAVCLAYQSYTTHTLSDGWSAKNFWGGGGRVFFSFPAGILLYRTKAVIKNKLGFIGVAILLFLAFIFPFRNHLAWITDLVTVLLYLPLMVSLGAGAYLSDGFKKICKFLGDLSYPLYMIHYPFLWVFFSYTLKYKPGIQEMSVIIPIATIALITLAYLIMKLIDMPIRKSLRRQLRKELD